MNQWFDEKHRFLKSAVCYLVTSLFLIVFSKIYIGSCFFTVIYDFLCILFSNIIWLGLSTLFLLILAAKTVKQVVCKEKANEREQDAFMEKAIKLSALSFIITPLLHLAVLSIFFNRVYIFGMLLPEVIKGMILFFAVQKGWLYPPEGFSTGGASESSC